MWIDLYTPLCTIISSVPQSVELYPVESDRLPLNNASRNCFYICPKEKVIFSKNIRLGGLHVSLNV